MSRAFWQEVLRYWMWFLKVSFVSKIRPRNFASFTTFIGVFPRRMLGSGKKTYCWWKWIQTVLEVENLKPFLDTHFWTRFTHSCIPLSTLFNVFPLRHKTKLSTNKEQSVPFKTALTMLLILMLKRAGDKMLPCGTPISCSCSLERVEPTLTPKKRSDRKLWINLGRWPLKPRFQRSARMPCFQVVS